MHILGLRVTVLSPNTYRLVTQRGFVTLRHLILVDFIILTVFARHYVILSCVLLCSFFEPRNKQYINKQYINKQYINKQYINKQYVNKQYINKQYINKLHKQTVHKQAVHKQTVHKQTVHKQTVHKQTVHKQTVHKPKLEMWQKLYN